MNDLADFLRARYTEVKSQAESIRRITVPTPPTFNGHDVEWRYDMDKGEVLFINGHPYPIEDYWRQVSEPAPDMKVIADLDAKLAVVDLMDRQLKYAEGDSEVDHYGALGAAEETLALLAQPFAGHPDYKAEEWAP